MTDREPFAKWVLERDRSYFIYAGGELLDFSTSQDSAEQRCERLNLAFEKAVAKREAVRSDWPCAAGFKAGLERAAGIAGRQTGWEANTIRDDIRAEIEKI